MARNLAPETVTAQAGGAIDAETGGIVPPLHVATTFIRDPDNQYRKGYSYGRPDNATVRQVESVLTELEGGAAGMVLASGMTAATTAFLALERPAHVVAPNVMYWGLRKWLQEDAPSLGIEATFVAGGHDNLQFQVQDGPTPSWKASLSVAVEAGEEMTSIAREVAALIPAART